MAIAALPDYLRGRDLAQASPGLRFGMYLPVWEPDATTGAPVALVRDGKAEVFRFALPLGAHVHTLRALRARQSALAIALAQQGRLLTAEAVSVSPFATGLGHEHPLENGFAFLDPYGLPYLAGSGVKGVLHAAARELAAGEWGDAQGWTGEAITALFGVGSGSSGDGLGDDEGGQRGALVCWDVLPLITGDKLRVDVMTAHQSHYLQQRTDKKSGDSTSPHDSGQPNPINFLTVPPGSAFSFHVQCDLPRLKRSAVPELAQGDRWQTLVLAALRHAFEWLGFGAKTAVGYGSFKLDEQAQAKQQRDLQAAQKAEAAKGRSPQRNAVAEYEDKMRERVATGFKKAKISSEWYVHARTLAQAAEGADWPADDKRAAADAIEHWLPQVVDGLDMKDVRKKLKLRALRGEA